MAVSVVTLAPLTLGPDITSRTIILYLQITFSALAYAVGGVPAGVATYADANGINATKYLFSNIQGEDTVVDGSGSLPTVGGVVFKYIPATDKIQLFDGRTGLQFTESEAIPAAVLNDTIVGQFIYERL